MKRIAALLVVILVACSLMACAKPQSLDLQAARRAIENTDVYGSLDYPNSNVLKEVYGIDDSLIAKRLIAMPMMVVQANLYMVVLPNEDARSEVKAQLDAFMKSHENTWADYLPDQYKLVEDRLETTISTKEGIYFVYIISEDNRLILDAIKSALIE